MKKKVLPVIIVIAFIILIGIIYAGQLFYEKFSYSKDRADLSAYFGIENSEDVPVIYGNEQIEIYAKNTDGKYYLDFDSVQTYLNDRFYYGQNDGILVYTTPTAIITAAVDASSWTSTDGTSNDEGYKIAYLDGETLYVALDYVQKYTDFEYESYSEPDRIQITASWDEEQTTATINKDTALRIRGGVKSEILEDLEKGETVVVLEKMENWSKVKSGDAFIGYVENKRLSDETTAVPAHEAVYVEPEYTSISKDYKINVGFHAIGGTAGNDTLQSVVANTKSLNTIAPTWISISDNSGNIRSYASADYVTQAHALGLEVWAVVDNFNGPEDVSTEEVLTHAASRANLISQIMQQVDTYGFDGINLDFELIDESYAQSYIEFIRELSVSCRAKGIVFSIDNYVPMNFNNHYNLEEQGIVADYVLIMGYDEHYAGSEEAGSVASIDYVENGIVDAIAMVDASKVLNAIPFYTRIWKTSGGEVSSQAVDMTVANEYIQSHSINMTWDEETCQYYGEFTDEDGALVQIWLEDAKSIEAKLGVMSSNNIAGVGEWELGFETSDVWDVIEAYVNG